MHHSTSSNSTFYIRNDWDCALVACASLKLIFEFGHALSYRLTNHSVVISRESFCGISAARNRKKKDRAIVGWREKKGLCGFASRSEAQADKLQSLALV